MPIDGDNKTAAANKLRRRAEQRLKTETPEPLPQTEQDIHRLLHELQVHQIELEMQNSELSKASDELERTLQEFTDLYDFAPVGYFTLGRNGTIRAVNLTGASLLGMERSRLIGRRFGLFIAVESRHDFTDFLGRVITSGCRESLTTTLLNEAGDVQIIAQIEAVASASGQVIRCAVIDITERRHTEESLAENRLELAELNKSLESRIVQAVEELRQKDQMMILHERQAIMGEMINNIAHQWRQPLNALGLVIQQLPIYYDAGDLSSEFLKDKAAMGMRLIQHMSRTIDDFRNFFKSDKEIITFAVSEAIAQTLSLIEQSFVDMGITITLQVEDDLIVVGYPNEYAQVLLNVLLNARDQLVNNNVASAMISLCAFEEGGKTVITITDNAGGISDDIIDKIFDPYFTTKGPDKGSGIGLFMSKTIVEKNMQGRITARNTGSGAEFRIEVNNGGNRP